MLGPADERIAAFVEAEELVGCPGDADAHGPADGSRGLTAVTEPERAGSAQVEAIVAAVDLQRGGEPSGTTGEIGKAGSFAVALHDFDAFEGLERANQDRRGGGRELAHDVEHEVRAIVEENVGMARGEIHRADARRWAAVVMTRGIARGIGFGLDDAAADASCGEIVDHDFANEESREFNRVMRQF